MSKFFECVEDGRGLHKLDSTYVIFLFFIYTNHSTLFPGFYHFLHRLIYF